MDTKELEELRNREGQKHQGVDTRDLVLGMKGLNVAVQTGEDLAGKGERLVEAGVGDIRGRWNDIPGGWEKVWVQDPWMGKWEQFPMKRQNGDCLLYTSPSPRD